MKLRKLINPLHFHAFLLIVLATVPSLSAETWSPSGPVTLEIGAGVGGETDAIGRVFASTLKKQTGWEVIAQNKPGGAGIAMLSAMKNKRPDGTTLGLAINMPVLVNLVLRGDKLPFNLDHFDYLGTLASAGLAIVARSDAPFNNIEELVAYSKKHGSVTIATDSKPQELIMKGIAKQSGAKFKILSTKSSGEQLQFLLGDKAMVGLPSGKHIPYLATNQLKMLASANSKRHSYALETETLIEQGFNLFVDPFFYFVAPKGLDPIVEKTIVAAIDMAVQSTEVKDIVKNVLSSEAENLGAKETRSMLDNGFSGVKVLFN
ncbi:tripartite tricarboxylate transporter substrate binding protein [Marinomonas agarivorans]|nr:tripartite tricarboxylate transporter substrate binding protein [Marinomonas agarivorans]